MTNKEILEKVIKNTVKNGYSQEQIDCFWKVMDNFNNPLSLYQSEWKSMLIKVLVLDPDFAKAFWKNEPKYCSACRQTHFKDGVLNKSDCDAGFGIDDLEGWEFHLQQMILKPEPLKYLERFLEEKK